jgi:uncharacterized protein (TIGR00369 family)
MTHDQNAEDWVTQQTLARQRAQDGGGQAGVASPAKLAGKSGLQILQAMMSGELPYPHMNETLGLDLIEIGDGHAVFQGAPSRAHYNPMGTVHGGWHTTLLDSALGCAVQSKLPAGRAYTTAELSIKLVRSASEKTGPLRAIAHVVHHGKQLITAEAKVFDGAGKLYAHASTTCFVFALPPATGTAPA